MRQLLQGMETRATIDTLLALTKITSGPKIDAIYFHLVAGASLGRSAVAHGVPQPKLSEAVTTLNEVAAHCEKYHELKVYEPDTAQVKATRIRAVLESGCATDEAILHIQRLTA